MSNYLDQSLILGKDLWPPKMTAEDVVKALTELNKSA